MLVLLGFVCGAILGAVAGIPNWMEGNEQGGYLIVVGFGIAGAILLPLMNRVISK